MSLIRKKFSSRSKYESANDQYEFDFTYDRTYLKQTAFVKKDSQQIYSVEKIISEVENYKSEDKQQVLKSLKRQTLKLLCYFVLFLVYVFLGAAIFFYIEECSGADIAEDVMKPEITQITFNTSTCRFLFIEEYERINTTARDFKYINTTSRAHIIETNFFKICERLIRQSTASFKKKEDDMKPCDFTSQIMLKYISFALFTILSIGYGNTTPITNLGRGLLVLYAIIGIPIAVTMYRSIAKLTVQILILLVRCFDRKLHGQEKQVKFLHMKVLLISIFVMLAFVGFCCLTTTKEAVEGWTFASSFYFWFVSFTLIGYGDLTFSQEKQLERPFYLVLSFTNILFGLALSATVIEAYATTIRQRANSVTRQKDEIENKEELNADVEQILLQLGIFSATNIRRERFIGSRQKQVKMMDDIKEASL